MKTEKNLNQRKRLAYALIREEKPSGNLKHYFLHLFPLSSISNPHIGMFYCHIGFFLRLRKTEFSFDSLSSRLRPQIKYSWLNLLTKNHNLSVNFFNNNNSTAVKY
ncbi:unnamed protein product [Blepharisma stoltei]|uniref:Maturase K n=1 Tax=Blepharisma stoltei TaxID=1481888 RepID=A0AAU9JAF4_9CILI|nr:unnamed protein product [Blepharisma stoltei]